MFADWDQITIPDDEHSIGEQRWVILGVSNRGNLLVVPHAERSDRIRIVSAWHANARQRKQYETKRASGKKPQQVPDYDFSSGVRGQYAARFAAGTNVVVLSPDVAEVFPDSEAVNEALRTLVRVSAKTVRTTSARKKRPA